LAGRGPVLSLMSLGIDEWIKYGVSDDRYDLNPFLYPLSLEYGGHTSFFLIAYQARLAFSHLSFFFFVFLDYFT
jgi:hypothetical protein